MTKTSTVCFVLLAIAILVWIACALQKRESYADGDVAPPSDEPQWCPKQVSTPDNIDPAFMEYCMQECRANQTVMPQLCPCACAQSLPYIA